MKLTNNFRKSTFIAMLCLLPLYRSFAQPVWVTSGAPLGNGSNYTYGGNSLTGPAHASGENISINAFTGGPSGVHIYRVDETPTITTGITGLGGNDRYFGVFMINGTGYTVTYNYTGSPFIDQENDFVLFNRTDNSVNWSDALATLNVGDNTLTKAISASRGEYIIGSSDAALPIELIYFSGYSIGDENILTWQTSTEINNNYFTLEKSENGNDFSVLNIIDGSGNSSFELNYSVTDLHPFHLTYYRLKQTDFDGSYTYSEIIAVLKSENEIEIIKIYPVPAVDIISYLIISNEVAEVNTTVINTSGEIVKRQIGKIDKNISKLEINVSDLADGIYLLSVETSTGLHKTSKQFVK